MRLWILGLIIMLVFGVAVASPSYAGEGEKTKASAKAVSAPAGASADQTDNVTGRHPIGNKAERGIKNVLFGWTEIPKRVVDITKESRNPFWGLAAGVFQGTGKAFARTASGIGDVATAPIRPTDKPFIQDDMDVK